MKYTLKKEALAAESNLDFEIGVNAPIYCKIVLQVEENLMQSLCAFLLFGHLKRIAFLSIIWLPYRKLWALISWTATFTQF